MSVGGIIGFEYMRVKMSFCDLMILWGFWVFQGKGDRKQEASEWDY